MQEDSNSLAERVAAVERAVSGGGTGLDGLEDAAALDARLADLESTVERLESRIADLDAAVQAVRGFAGGVRAVDRDIERRADLALAKVEALEAEHPGGGRLTVERAVSDGDDALERVVVGSADHVGAGAAGDTGDAAGDTGDTAGDTGDGAGDTHPANDAESGEGSTPLVDRLRDAL